MPNALDYTVFKFSEEKRKKIRNELNLNEKKIIGHVGRFNEQKNHDFLIDIFYELHKQEANTHLLLIGKGELEEKIKNKISNLGLDEFVTILPPVPNVNEYYMAMDVFVFPSFFEGMPNVVVEAQATGLPCVISDTITKEANITQNIVYRSINEEILNWTKSIISLFNMPRNDMESIFRKKNYLINNIVEMCNKYFF